MNWLLSRFFYTHSKKILLVRSYISENGHISSWSNFDAWHYNGIFSYWCCRCKFRSVLHKCLMGPVERVYYLALMLSQKWTQPCWMMHLWFISLLRLLISGFSVTFLNLAFRTVSLPELYGNFNLHFGGYRSYEACVCI